MGTLVIDVFLGWPIHPKQTLKFLKHIMWKLKSRGPSAKMRVLNQAFLKALNLINQLLINY